jgi:hypothetical protein
MNSGILLCNRCGDVDYAQDSSLKRAIIRFYCETTLHNWYDIRL